MRQQSKEYIVILFMAGALALNYPFLYLFDRAWLPFGIPLLYLYLYLVWFVVIALLIAIVEHSEIHVPDRSEPPPENVSQPEAAAAQQSGTDSGDRRSRS